MRPRFGAVVLVAVLVLAGCSTAPVQEATPTPTTPASETTTVEPPAPTTEPTTTPAEDDSEMVDSLPDPPEDRLGWENGYWYNETLDVNRTGGLNESELEAVVARGMARVEIIRGLEFNESVPVEIIDRSEFRNRTAERRGNMTDAQRLHQNVKFEATFLVGEDENAVTRQEDTTASSVLGFYDPSNHSIVIVSDAQDSLEMDEITLAQELFHAVQEQTFDASNITADTEERLNARNGIVEGDGNYVDHLYEQRCDGGWDCLEADRSGPGDGGDGGDTHVGMLVLRLQPYSDGPPFVRDIREESGWAGVDGVYEQPPESTEQTIHPEKYLDDSPTNVTVEDRSSEEWSIPDQGEGIDYAQFGEAGMFVMLWYPSHAESAASGQVTDVVIPYRHFFDTPEDDLDLYNYDHPATAGWDGDKLVPYVRNDSAETNETGYVWKSVWDSEADAAEFEEAYLELLVHHGAEPVPGRENTYRIDDGEFADAFAVRQDGSAVTIVNAPTVPDLPEVNSDAGLAD